MFVTSRVSLKNVREDPKPVEVVPPVKSLCQLILIYAMTSKDVKAFRSSQDNIPLDLHMVGPFTDEWTMIKLRYDFIGLFYDNYYCVISGVRLPFPHSFDVLDHLLCPFHKQGDWFTFERSVGPGSGGKILNETFYGLKGWKKSQSIVLVPSFGLLFHAGLATTWEFSGFLPVFKDTEGNVVTMSEYLRFPFLDGAIVGQGDALSARRKKRAADSEGGSKGKMKRRKVSAVRAEEEDSTEEASSTSPLRATAPNPSFLLKDVDDAGTAESREDEHVSIPRHDSANTSIHNYAEDHDESFNESEGHGLTMTETVETYQANETRLTETPVPSPNPEKTDVQDIVPVVRSNLAEVRECHAEDCRGRNWLMLSGEEDECGAVNVTKPLTLRNWTVGWAIGLAGKRYRGGPYGTYCGRSKIIESMDKAKDEYAESSCDVVRISVLNLVDLTSSKRAAKTCTEGVRLKEGSHINKSLMTLGTIIKKPSEGAETQGGHVPYQDNKLTRILQPALGRNEYTAIICNITLAQILSEE
ncbi:kinesin-like protein KIN-7O [Tanacetum coccineum]